MVNYYHILGLTENASPEEIRAAFKRLAVQYHPDKHPGRSEMEEKFKEVNHAHQVLSDPYEKARFDLKLKYQQFSQNHTYDHSYSRPAKAYPPRAQYYRRKVDKKTNIIATAYAFGITFLIASLVMGGVWAKRSYDNYLEEKELAQRRATFEKAKADFESGDYLSAFEIMSTFRFFSRRESDIKQFKNTMAEQIISKGNDEFEMGKFEAAISLYQFVLELYPKRTFYEVKKKLAEAYKLTGEVDKAMEILDDFLVNEYEIISSLVKLAEIQRDELNNLEDAMEHFQLAHKLAVKRYKRFYGEGYPLVIRQEHIPVSHYQLYTGLADMYLRFNNPRMAIKAADWNKYVWPDSTDAYVTTAKAYVMQNDPTNACMEYQEAALRGWSGELEIACN